MLSTKKIKGGFENDISFIKLNSGQDVLKFKQEKVGSTLSFSTYDVVLNPYQVNQGKKIAAEEFFQ
ncbi:hypothetical protein D3C83_140270 [compost metagenome]